MDEEQIKAKAKQMADMTKRIAKTSAFEFEKWMKENRDSSYEDSHKTLCAVIEAAVISSQFMLGVML